MQDLSKMSVKQLCDAYVVRLPWDAVVAELTRRIENAATHHGWRTVPPKGYVLCDDGVARKVLGTLPMTADGLVVGEGASPLWIWTDDDGLQNDGTSRLHLDHYDDYPVEYAYSTHEAAKAARAKEAK